MLNGLMSKLDGYKTYITGTAGILVAIVGCYFGPVDMGPVHIPKIDSSVMWPLVWNGLMALFIRNGVSKS